MTRKKTKGKGTKIRKAVAGKAVKKRGKATAKTSRAKAPVRGVAVVDTMDVLRAWSSSRYSTR